MFTKILIILSFIFLLISFWNRNDFSADMQAKELLRYEPTQEKVKQKAFSTRVNKIDYEIQPLYEYELYGLVVSYEHHDGNFGLHKLWGDHLNVADMCVVWKKNAFDINLQDYDFWNGQFTCNISTKNMQAWKQFEQNQLSNNHLLTDDKYIRSQIKKVGIGDQIRVKGWLSSYKNNQGGKRGTSITREDRGNGACETIFVQEFDIINSYTSTWRKIMYFSLLFLLLSIVWYIKKPHQAHGT